QGSLDVGGDVVGVAPAGGVGRRDWIRGGVGVREEAKTCSSSRAASNRSARSRAQAGRSSGSLARQDMTTDSTEEETQPLAPASVNEGGGSCAWATSISMVDLPANGSRPVSSS